MDYPFQLRDHGDGVIEMIVSEELRSDHKSVEALRILQKKFNHVILHLENSASLNASFSQVLAELAEKLLLVAAEDSQIAIDLHGVKRFTAIAQARSWIQGEKNLAAILEQFEKMPPLQSTGYKLMLMLQNPDVSFEDLEEVIAKDQSLADRMLSTSNSAFFVRRLPFESLKSVAAFLGIEGIRQIVLQEIFDQFARLLEDQPEKVIHMRRCAHLSACIGKLVGGDQNLVRKTYFAGLFHDLGALLLCNFNRQEYGKIYELVTNGGKTLSEAEKEIFGLDHQKLGGVLVEKMGLPDYLKVTAANHHDETCVPTEDLVLPAVMTANGFLNQFIDEMPCFTQYEHFLQVFSERRQARLSAAAARKAASSADETAEEDPFALPDFFDYLKAELEKFDQNSGVNA